MEFLDLFDARLLSVKQQFSMTVTVAVVDDDEGILDSVKLVLESYGWPVRTYPSGEAFLADLADDQRPLCLILDPHLPGLSGAEVAQSIVDGKAHIPIIGLTARPTSPMARALTNAGVRVMLTKPVTPEELVDQVQSAIGTVNGGQ